MSQNDYIVTIGIECHVQLKTKTKLFAAVDNDAREAEPNSLISHICLGLPGALPVLNSKAVELASMAAYALGTEPQKYSKFDRKHYFYPDLPMGYQISQYEEPIILGGYVDVTLDGKTKRINLTRAHLEADAGKSLHPAGADYSLVDLNRAGTPLLEIVSEPEMHSAAEAKAYAHELWLIIKYAGVSDVDLYHGNMRFDVNVSISKDPNKLGTRSETKNLNSFRSVEKAIEYEIKRQSELLDKGEKVVQETRGWDDAKQKTFSQRTKEDAHDYRYFPDPDLPPIELDDKYLDTIKTKMPKLPKDYRDEFKQIGINDEVIEDVLNSPENASQISEILSAAGPEHAKRIAFWFMQVLSGVEDGPDSSAQNKQKVPLKNLVGLSKMVDEGKLSSSAGKQVLKEMLSSGGEPEEIAEKLNLIQQSDAGELETIVKKVLEDNPQAASDVKSGEMKAIGFLVGQVMKASQGKANPGVVQTIIKKVLGV